MNNYKVIVVAPSRRGRGGITAVIKAYEKAFIWKKWNCIWIETYIDKSSIYKILFFLRGLLIFIIKVWNTDIVHIHLSEHTSAIRKSFFFYIAYFLRKKIILHFHSFSIDSTVNSKYKSIYRNLFKKSDTVIVLSQYWQKEIIRAFGEHSVNTKVLYNPCICIPDKPYTTTERKCHILYAGTLNTRKGYADLINAFSIVTKKHPDWKLIMAGNGEIDQGLALVKNLDISNQVTFTGWVSGEEKEKLFQEASIFCLPSYNEGFPMSVLDAWAYGLTVITTPVGGLPDVMIDGINGLFFTPGDINTLSDIISDLICNEELRNKLSKASLNFSKNEFSLENVSGQLDQIYSNLVL